MRVLFLFSLLFSIFTLANYRAPVGYDQANFLNLVHYMTLKNNEVCLILKESLNKTTCFAKGDVLIKADIKNAKYVLKKIDKKLNQIILENTQHKNFIIDIQ